jgi:hypothetical protein
MNDEAMQALAARLQAAFAGRLEIGDILGVGGFGAVFRAHDPLLRRDVAIKALLPEFAGNETAAGRLLDEARLVATAEHPHIVPLYEAGHRDGVVYLVMRYFPDGTAADRLAKRGPLSPAEVARLGLEVADALAAAHARGVIHLDIKPANILLDAEGHAAVADFGISRLTAAAAESPDGLVTGTPHYMSPEQASGDRVDGRADVYALGVVLYELTTGARPITGTSAAQTRANQVTQEPAPIATLAPTVPAALAAVIMRALRKDPAERWHTAKDMADALRAASASDRLLSPKQMRRRTRRRWFTRTALIATGLAAGMIGVAYLAFQIWMGFRTGVPPGIDAVAPNIPAAIIDSARTLGALTGGDSVIYVFAPNGQGVRNALLVTPEELVVIRDGAARRYAHSGYTLLLARTNRRGLVILKLRDAPPDTLYHSITGLEQQVLELGLRRALQ